MKLTASADAPAFAIWPMTAFGKSGGSRLVAGRVSAGHELLAGNCHTADVPIFAGVREPARGHRRAKPMMHPHQANSGDESKRLAHIFPLGVHIYRRRFIQRTGYARIKLVSRCFRKAPEEAVCLPLRPLRIVRHSDHELPDDVFVLPGRREVDRLVEIVRRRMIAVGQPVLVQSAFPPAWSGQYPSPARECRDE